MSVRRHSDWRNYERVVPNKEHTIHKDIKRAKTVKELNSIWYANYKKFNHVDIACWMVAVDSIVARGSLAMNLDVIDAIKTQVDTFTERSLYTLVYFICWHNWHEPELMNMIVARVNMIFDVLAQLLRVLDT